MAFTLSSNITTRETLTGTADNPAIITAAGTLDAGLLASAISPAWTVTNAGSILAAGATLVSAGTLANSGLIAGATTAHGYGILLEAGGDVTNSGSVTGFYGVQIDASAGTLFNIGLIAGGSIGVDLRLGGTVTDAGSIAGTVDSVNFGTEAGRLIMQPGGAVSGTVVSDAAVFNVLEFTGPTGTLTGLGTQYTGFSEVVADPGTYWTLAGGNTVTASMTLSGAFLNTAVFDGTSGTNAAYAATLAGGSGGAGLRGVALASGASVTNTGTLGGGAGGAGAKGGVGNGGQGVSGAAGVSIGTAFLANHGLVAGGNGGAGGGASKVAGASGGAGGGGGLAASLTTGTIVNYGTISGGAGSSGGASTPGGAGRGGAAGAGGTAVTIAGGTLINASSGIILGGASGNAGSSGGNSGAAATSAAGGFGIKLSTGTVLNSGTIAAGAGGAGGQGGTLATTPGSGGGAGGDGLYASSGGFVSNSATGRIQGAAGGAGGLTTGGTVSGTGGAGGAGAFVGGSTLINAGTILGAAGGTGGGDTAAAAAQPGGAGGAGAVASASLITNFGYIAGAPGGAGGVGEGGATAASGSAGAGVVLVGAIFTNFGTIVGGGAAAAGVAASDGGTVANYGTIAGGAGGDAVSFAGTGTNASRVVLGAGATFIGSVVDTGTASTLELKAASGTLAGFGSKYTGFNLVTVDSGAAWTLAAGDTLGSGVTLTDAGSLTNPISIGAKVTLATGAYFLNEGTDTGGVTYGSNVSLASVLNRGLLSGTSSAQYVAFISPGGTLTNAGTIAGSVRFGSGASRFVVDPGATVTGSVVANSNFTNVLELAAGTSGTLSISGAAVIAGGVKFFSFSRVLIDPGATWVSAGGVSYGTGYVAALPNITLASTIATRETLSGTIDNAALIAASGLLKDGLYAATLTSALWTVTNLGTILAPGVTLASAGTLTNRGTIAGAASGTAGVGVLLTGITDTLVNSGVLTGYIGAEVTSNLYSPVTNTGTISGGIYGVLLPSGGTVINAGTISGSADAVKFAGGGVLIIDGGASFVGTVASNPTAGNIIELGSGVGTLGGIGTAFTGFKTLTADPGTQWTLTGTNSSISLAGTLLNAGSFLGAAGANAVYNTSGDTVGSSGAKVLSGAVTNTGTLSGGGGGNGSNAWSFAGAESAVGAAGGNGVVISAGLVSNSGLLAGGGGGTGGPGGTLAAGSGGGGGAGAADSGTLVNSGTVRGGAGGAGGAAAAGSTLAVGAGGAGGAGISLAGTFSNSTTGLVIGGSGGTGGSDAGAKGSPGAGGAAGAGIAFVSGYLVNAGTILAGAGGAGGQGGTAAGAAGIAGGAGVLAVGASGIVVSNSSTGIIQGGAGGAAGLTTGTIAPTAYTGGNGGSGVALDPAGPGRVLSTLVNRGTITGGAGGAGGGSTATAGSAGGSGGAGVSWSAQSAPTNIAVITNLGYIVGGAAGPGGVGIGGTTASSGRAGIGVALYATTATLINDGTIAAGAGGTVAVAFDGQHYNDRLILGGSAAFDGQIEVSSGVTLALELAANGGPGTLSGLGSALTRVSSVTIDSGAAWTLTGVTKTAGVNSPGATYTVADSGSLTTVGSDAVTVSLTAGGYLLNTGTIGTNVIGSGTGNTVVNRGTIGGGVGLGTGATLINAGAITSGVAGPSRLVIEAGASFGGSVVAGTGLLNVLELAAGSAGTLSVSGTTAVLLGQTFTGFGEIVIDSGATWRTTNGGTYASGTLGGSGIITNTAPVSGAGGADYTGLYGLSRPGGAGAPALRFIRGILTNAANVLGGKGGTGEASAAQGGSGGKGGDAVAVNAPASQPATFRAVEGLLKGGDGGYGVGLVTDSRTGGVGGDGGRGLYVAYANVTNAGTIQGGAGGDSQDTAAGSGGAGGAGVYVRSGALTNTGTILGGDPGNLGVPGFPAAAGFAGTGVVFAAGGTLQDSGVIAGGAGGAGYAVNFGTGAARLVIGGGAVLDGVVRADASLSNALELSASGSGNTISGLGSQFVGFNQVTLDAGSDWTLTGANTLVAGSTVTNAGTLDIIAAKLKDPGGFINDGTVVIDPSDVTLGSLVGTGVVTIDTGSTLAVQGTVSAGETIVFAGDGELDILPSAFAGTIAGIDSTDLIVLTGVTAATGAGIVNGNTLQVTQTGSAAIDLTLAAGTIYTGETFAVTAGGMLTEVPCFLRDTRIATDRGEVMVQHLVAGDRVRTLSGAYRPITWIGTGKVLVSPGKRSDATPVIVRRAALGANEPYYDLRITKGHALFLDGVLVPAEFMVNHRTIEWDDHKREVEFYHIELETHDVILANGAALESYRDDGNRWLFRNANTSWDMPPKPPFAPVLTGGPLVDAIWRRLLDRAPRRPAVPLTTDPDLHLLADGVRLDPAFSQGERHVFRLADRPALVLIASRSAAPDVLGIARDPRVLGVAVRRLLLAKGRRVRVMEADDAALAEGFHAYEPDGPRRWTDGEATVPAVLFEGYAGPMQVEIHLNGATQYLAGLAAAERAAG